MENGAIEYKVRCTNVFQAAEDTEGSWSNHVN